MRSRFAWLVAGLGAVAAAARLLKRPPARAVDAHEPESDPRAEDLRRRIDESRGLEDDREEFESAETPVDAADPETRRRHVHERGRAAVEQMRAHGGAEE